MHATEFIEPTQPEIDPKRRYLCRHILRSIRPPRRSHKKWTKSKANLLRNIT